MIRACARLPSASRFLKRDSDASSHNCTALSGACSSSRSASASSRVPEAWAARATPPREACCHDSMFPIPWGCSALSVAYQHPTRAGNNHIQCRRSLDRRKPAALLSRQRTGAAVRAAAESEGSRRWGAPKSLSHATAIPSPEGLLDPHLWLVPLQAVCSPGRPAASLSKGHLERRAIRACPRLRRRSRDRPARLDIEHKPPDGRKAAAWCFGRS